jgi:putative acyl-CoA dehydrogenase
MTFAAVPSLKIDESIAKEWLPRIYSTEYDARFIPYFDKKGVTFGMGMTEPQGGSDVRAITSFAKKVTQNGDYEIYGRKWFCSAPMSDAFLILAQSDKGLSCFLLPRFRPDGSKNAFHIQRLKDKLGNLSNASGEVEFHGARAQIIGEEGRGVANIMEMVRHTRLDCAVGSSGTMRKAVAEAINHCTQRKAFGKLLLEQPLMKNVLADLALENIQERNFTRIATAAGKFWITKRAITAVAEAMECLGGNGYVEESIMPRLYRDVPVNSIWEGSGNVQCLDVLRSLQKEPETMEALMIELNASGKMNKNYDAFLKKLEKELLDKSMPELRARRIAEQLALALQAGILLKTTPEFVADSFCNARLTDEMHLSFGTLPDAKNMDALIERANPHTD